jgi:hypothetical protein
MNLVTQPFFEQKNLQSIDDVLLALERLGHDLPEVRLQPLDNFNQTYLIITRNVRQQLRKGAFQHPEFLDQFDRRFAYYYLRALQSYLRGETESVPLAWQRAFQAAERKDVSPLVCMALGVNAHVNNDIPQVLRDCGAGYEHYADYLRVNGIIRASLGEVIGLFKDTGSLLNPNKRLQRPAFLLGMGFLVKLWRGSAWHKFQKLRHEKTAVPRIESRAGTLSRGIEKLPI